MCSFSLLSSKPFKKKTWKCAPAIPSSRHRGPQMCFFLGTKACQQWDTQLGLIPRWNHIIISFCGLRCISSEKIYIYISVSINSSWIHIRTFQFFGVCVYILYIYLQAYSRYIDLPPPYIEFPWAPGVILNSFLLGAHMGGIQYKLGAFFSAYICIWRLPKMGCTPGHHGFEYIQY